jgi:hypothetical protein
MSATGTSAPAGWYPDPADRARGRYWNGIAWTELFHTPGQPFPAGAEPKAPPGTDGNTVWIWLVVFAPLLPVLLLLFVPWGSMFDIDVTASSPSSAVGGTYALFFSPFYWGSAVLGWTIYGLSVFFAYRDVKELRSRGVPQPFHWAWVFISGLVYAVGRSVVVARRTGKGYAPIWVEAGVLLVNIVVMIVIVAAVLGGMTEFMESLRTFR